MFRHVLITLDGSKHSERVLAYAADLARPLGAAVTLLSILPEPASPSSEDAANRERLATSESYLDGHAQALRQSGVREVYVRVRSGPIVREVLAEARERDVDLIAMSTQGTGARGEDGLGSVAAAVLRGAPCPVFMVRVERPAPPRGPEEEQWQAEGGRNVG